MKLHTPFGHFFISYTKLHLKSYSSCISLESQQGKNAYNLITSTSYLPKIRFLDPICAQGRIETIGPQLGLS